MSTKDVVLGALLVVVLIPCAVIDFRTRKIPNKITGPAALVAIVVGTALDPGNEWGRLLAGALAGGFFLFLALLKPGGLGMGDVKLLGVMGLFLGAPVVVALFIALITNTLTGVVLATRVGVKKARKTHLAFGPYLALGGIVAAGVGHQALRLWLGTH
ncbi:MAG: prepilin peptidase [Solirubrobacterales bacterium]|nr:prepilin peptidase [Solirubrobacterales bacterium]